MSTAHGDLGRLERQDWVVRAGSWEMAAGYLRHIPRLPSGERTQTARGEAELRLPQRGARKVAVSVKVRSPEPLGLEVRLDDLAFHFGTRFRTPTGQARPLRTFTPRESCRETMLFEGCAEKLMGLDPNCRAEPGRTHELKIVAELATARFYVDGKLIFSHEHARQRPWRMVSLVSWCESEFSDIQVATGDVIPALPHPHRKERFILSTSFDGINIRHHVWLTPAMIASVFRELKQIGFNRVYVIDYGSAVPEFWSDPEMIRLHRERYGHLPGYEHMRWKGEWLKLMADLAHETGLEFYTKFKVFDLHLWSENPHENFTDLERVQYEHREKKLERRPAPPEYAAPDAPVGAIRFVKEDDALSSVSPADLRLWVSDDNLRYRPYEGPIRRRETVEPRAFMKWWEETLEPPRLVRILHLEGLHITSPYFAVTVAPHCTEELFRNQLHRLVEITAEDGRPFPFTYMLHPDAAPTPGAGPEDFPWHGPKIWRGGLRVGIYWGGVPTGSTPVVDAMERMWALDNVCRVIGFARGLMRYAGSAFCPAYDEVHDFWLSRIRTAYECGADGVDLRIRNHNKCMEWARMGYNPPVVAEYRRRYGVDITREPTDRVKHQKLLGEYYTNFLRKARALSRQYGRALQHHVSISMDVAPEQMSMMHIYWDWRAWIEEGLIDEITLKEVFPGTNFFDEVMDLARAKGIRAHFCPFMNTILARDPNYDQVIGRRIAEARAEGLDGYWLHEAYCIIKAQVEQERVELTHPRLAEAIRKAIQ